MFEHWKRRHEAWKSNPIDVVAFDLLLEVLLMTIQDLDAKLDAIKTGVDALKADIAALKNQPPAVATQADLDALGAKMDAVQAAINS